MKYSGKTQTVYTITYSIPGLWTTGMSQLQKKVCFNSPSCVWTSGTCMMCSFTYAWLSGTCMCSHVFILEFWREGTLWIACTLYFLLKTHLNNWVSTVLLFCLECHKIKVSNLFVLGCALLLEHCSFFLLAKYSVH